jgi:hypothetical protein
MSFKAGQALGDGHLSAKVDPAVAASEYQRTILCLTFDKSHDDDDSARSSVWCQNCDD